MAAVSLSDTNLFAYCCNNPVVRKDTKGEYFETALDIASLCADVIEIAANPYNPIAWGALAADVACLILPGMTGGGTIVRVVTKSDNILDAAKYADDIIDSANATFSNWRLGQKLHSTYNPIQNTVSGNNIFLNQSLTKWGSRLRPDAIDFTNRIIYELKPYNKQSFKRSLIQTEKYGQALGGSWTIVIDMYKW